MSLPDKCAPHAFFLLSAPELYLKSEWPYHPFLFEVVCIFVSSSTLHVRVSCIYRWVIPLGTYAWRRRGTVRRTSLECLITWMGLRDLGSHSRFNVSEHAYCLYRVDDEKLVWIWRSQMTKNPVHLFLRSSRVFFRSKSFVTFYFKVDRHTRVQLRKTSHEVISVPHLEPRVFKALVRNNIYSRFI